MKNTKVRVFLVFFIFLIVTLGGLFIKKSSADVCGGEYKKPTIPFQNLDRIVVDVDIHGLERQSSQNEFADGIENDGSVNITKSNIQEIIKHTMHDISNCSNDKDIYFDASNIQKNKNNLIYIASITLINLSDGDELLLISADIVITGDHPIRYSVVKKSIPYFKDKKLGLSEMRDLLGFRYFSEGESLNVK